jgi:hypothetical protein
VKKKRLIVSKQASRIQAEVSQSKTAEDGAITEQNGTHPALGLSCVLLTDHT